VVDLAIGVIIGAAFGKIIDSMVNDIMMPIIGRIFGGLDLHNYFIGLTPAASQAPTYDARQEGRRHAGLRQLHHPSRSTSLIIAWILFLVIKGMNRLFAQEQAAPPPPAPPTKRQELLTEIRDLLRGARFKLPAARLSRRRDGGRAHRRCASAAGGIRARRSGLGATAGI